MALAAPAGPQPGQLTVQIRLGPAAIVLLAGQQALGLAVTALALGETAQLGQGVQQGLIHLYGVAPFAQAGQFFPVRGQLAFAGFAGLLGAGQARRTVFGKAFAHRGQAFQPDTGHAPFVPLPPDAQTALQQAALLFQFAFMAAQVGQGRFFARELQGQAVKARAFRGHVLDFAAQLFQLTDGRVERRFAAAALENVLGLPFQDLQHVAGRAQARAEARAVQGVAHALGAQAFKALQLAQAEAEDIAVDLAADAEEQLSQQFGRQHAAVRLAQGQHAAARTPAAASDAGVPARPRAARGCLRPGRRAGAHSCVWPRGCGDRGSL